MLNYELHCLDKNDIQLNELLFMKQAMTLPQWFVMRDLKRSNAKQPAYKLLNELSIKCFTPMVWKVAVSKGKRILKKVPFMQDLLFVYDSRRVLDPIVERIVSFQNWRID